MPNFMCSNGRKSVFTPHPFLNISGAARVMLGLRNSKDNDVLGEPYTQPNRAQKEPSKGARLNLRHLGNVNFLFPEGDHFVPASC